MQKRLLPRLLGARTAIARARLARPLSLCSANRQSARFPTLRFRDRQLSLLTLRSTERKMATATSETFTRLPEIAKPSNYEIYLKPNLSTFKCEGRETISVDVLEATDFLKLHSSEIEIKSVKIKLANGTVHESLAHEVDRKWMTLTVKLPAKIEPQEVFLSIEFVADHNDHMQGFYRSAYTVDGAQKHLVSTQFESTYARLSFPCWDEPVYKAKFDVSLEVDENLTALSNMNVISTTPTGNGTKVVKYNTTPVMSSYLVAFAVGEFEYIEAPTKNGCPVRVYTVKGKKDQGAYSLKLATQALDYYNEWFGIEYPLPKCDLIAIPDFSMGAMENWGLVTFREVALLVDPAKTSTRQSMYVALVVAHELAHFWFGDLATMKWWDGLWLKEGFASFMEYLFVSKHCPEFEIWVHFVNDEWSRGTSLDALRSSHPIEVPIDNPNELDEIYDSITYAKSNSVIRMLCNYLTEPVFQDGLRRYLKKYQYSNAVTQDLWDCFTEASGQDIGSMMSSWTRQMGFPLISVSQKVEGNKRTFTINQERFLADGGADENNPLWQVPLTFITASSPDTPVHRTILTSKSQEIVVENVDPNDWVKVNAGTAGFYRVQYSEDMLKALLPAVTSKTLSVLDRYGIANDIFALVESGKAPADQFLAFVEASVNENEYVVWGAIDAGVSALFNVLNHHDDPSLKAKFSDFVCKVYGRVLERLTWDAVPKEELKTSLLRGLVVNRLSRANHKETIEKASQLFEDHVNKKVELHPDLRAAIYSVVARNGGEEALKKLRNIFETCGFGEVERNCIAAMAQTSDSTLLENVFTYGVKDNKIRSQDLVTLFAGARTTRVGQDYTWNFFKANQELLLKRFGNVNSSLFQHCFKCSTDAQCSNAFAEELESFCKGAYDEHSLKILDRPIRQSAESVRLNAELLKRSAPAIKTFLA